MSGSAVVAASMNPFIKELEEEARLLARLKNKIVTQIATLQVCQPLLLLIPMWLSLIPFCLFGCNVGLFLGGGERPKGPLTATCCFHPAVLARRGRAGRGEWVPG